MSWYDYAMQAIVKQVDYAQKTGITDKKEQMRFVSKHFPFGERKLWPYKAWLRAKHDFFFGAKKRGRPKKLDAHQLSKDEKKAQLKLF